RAPRHPGRPADPWSAGTDGREDGAGAPVPRELGDPWARSWRWTISLAPCTLPRNFSASDGTELSDRASCRGWPPSARVVEAFGRTRQKSGPTNGPGQMTAVMRAMPQVTGPKVLRIGLVQGGKVIEERVIKQRTSVTIGPSEKSMFVIPSRAIPPSFKLFEL